MKYTIVTRTKPACVYCEAAKRLLTRKNLPWVEIEYQEAAEKVAPLNYRSLPMVFRSETEEGERVLTTDNFVGGYEDLQKLLY